MRFGVLILSVTVASGQFGGHQADALLFARPNVVARGKAHLAPRANCPRKVGGARGGGAPRFQALRVAALNSSTSESLVGPPASEPLSSSARRSKPRCGCSSWPRSNLPPPPDPAQPLAPALFSLSCLLSRTTMVMTRKERMGMASRAMITIETPKLSSGTGGATAGGAVALLCLGGASRTFLVERCTSLTNLQSLFGLISPTYTSSTSLEQAMSWGMVNDPLGGPKVPSSSLEVRLKTNPREGLEIIMGPDTAKSRPPGAWSLYATEYSWPMNSGREIWKRKLPSCREKAWMRPFSRSATQSSCWGTASTTLWGMAKVPGGGALLPNEASSPICRRNLPILSKCTMRALQYPSAT
uniref:Putative secreted protein n=1 Tax=Ixodes ricinus TaxID=34613 RepID=A0A6B0V8X5_IXORI